MYIDGHAYYGNGESLDGWTPKIGNFHILATAPSFKRYIAHKPFTIELMERYYEKIAKLAHKYKAEPTKVIRTHGKFYTHEKFVNIFFLGRNSFYQKDLGTIQRVVDEGKLAKEILFNIEIGLWTGRTDSGSVIVDIKEPLKKVHAELFKSLDAILFPA